MPPESARLDNGALAEVRLAEHDKPAIAAASDTQIEAAQDSLVTFAEYEHIVLDTIRCYERIGYESRYGLLLTASGYFYLEFVPTKQVDLSADKAECRRKLDPIHRIWSEANVKSVSNPVTQDLLNDASGAFWDCMDTAGVERGEVPPGIEAVQAVLSRGLPSEISALMACQEAILLEFGLPGFVG